jgi:hypothetical protein
LPLLLERGSISAFWTENGEPCEWVTHGLGYGESRRTIALTVANAADLDEEQQRAKQDVLLELNARVHDAARRFEGAEPELDLWDFTCECGAPDCRAPVSLTLAQYEALRAAEQPLLADGHDARRPAKAREHSEELRADSEALKAEALLQQQRARRNRRRA